MHKQRLAMLIGAAAGLLACFLPWVSTPIGSMTGIQGDAGKVMAAGFAVAVLLPAFIGDRSRAMPLAPVAFASLIGAASAGDAIWMMIRLGDAQHAAARSDSALAAALAATTGPAIGLYLVIATGIAVPMSYLLTGKAGA